VGARWAAPRHADALLRVRWTLPQAALGRADRLVNIRGSFLAARDLSGKRVLLVDDVMTTGATMGECARTCRAAGAVRVHALTFAR
jgi:predicted amidophosphoribosyltransferase